MTKSLLPWSLKGVSLEARARAKAAAGEAGEPLGKWLGDTIRQVAEAEAAKTSPSAAEAADPPRPAVPMAASASDEDETASAGTDLAILRAPQAIPNAPAPVAFEHAPAAPPTPAAGGVAAEAAVASADDDWRTALADLSERLDESERRLTAAVAPLQVAVERILSRLDRDRPRRGWRFPGFGRRRNEP